MKRNMAEKLTASILAAVLTFGMMAPQTAMTAEAAAKSTLEKDVQKLVKKSKAKKEKTQKKEAEKTVPVCGEKLRLCKGDRL